MNVDEQLRNGWIEEQKLVRAIRDSQKRLREVRQSRVRLLTDLCTDRPLIDAVEAAEAKRAPPPAKESQSREEIDADNLTVELINGEVPVGLARELAELLAQVEDMAIRIDLHCDLEASKHPEEWVARLRVALSRQHLIEPLDLTSEYAILYLSEVSQRATDLFTTIAEWRRLQRDHPDPIFSWRQWFEVQIKAEKSLPNHRLVYRYGDLTSQADGLETVECDFHMSTSHGPEVITKVLGPASRSVSGDTIRDQIRYLTLAVYEDVCHGEEKAAAKLKKPARDPQPKAKKPRKGGGQ